MNRRDLLKLLVASPVGLMFDWEKLLWVPGAKKIFIPPALPGLPPYLLRLPLPIVIGWDRAIHDTIYQFHSVLLAAVEGKSVVVASSSIEHARAFKQGVEDLMRRMLNEEYWEQGTRCLRRQVRYSTPNETNNLTDRKDSLLPGKPLQWQRDMLRCWSSKNGPETD